MSLFRPPEKRSVTGIAGWGRGDDVALGSSMEASLSVVPVFAACRLISDSIATLPLQAYRKSGDVRTPIPLPAVFDKETRIEWVQQALMSLLLHGNAYGLVVAYAGDGTPQTVVWLNPEYMQIDESGPLPVFRYNGRDVTDKIKHIPAYSIPGSVKGVSPIRACSLMMDTGAATQKMMGDWFKGRAIPGVTVKNNKKTLNPVEAEAIADRVRAKMRNGQPFVHGEDWDITVMQMPAQDAGFVSALRLNATQVATIYGLPPEEIGGETGSSLTYSTEELNQLKLQRALQPWMAKLEQEFSAWMLRPRFVKFNADAMIRVDTKTRYDVHRIAREIGLVNIDELRRLEDMEPLPDGQGQSYAPLAQAGAAAKESRELAERSHELALREAEKPPVINVDARTEVRAPVNVHPTKIDVDARTDVMLPTNPVTLIDDRAAPEVTVNVDPTPVQIVNEAAHPAEVTVNVDPTPVRVMNRVQPADVVLPRRRRRVVKDESGQVVETIEEDL